MLYDEIEKLVTENFTDSNGYVMSCTCINDIDSEIAEEVQRLIDTYINSEDSYVNFEIVFDSPGVAIGYLACSWIENGKLHTYLTPTYDC